jgi:lipopolysaccharide transport system ATP-binding protein
MLGLIGPNGSGKSTILKMLNGIYMPDKGRIQVNGRVGALIEVGAGFHPMLTGRENVYVNGTILGMSRMEIERKFDDIVDFSEIGDFIDTPVKHYSSGMYMRLGFAVAAYSEPDILLVDEVLAVGDARFHNKCINKIRELMSRDTAIVLVTHGGWYLQSLCHRAILINQGKVVKEGNPLECYSLYTRMGSSPAAKRGPALPSDNVPIVIRNLELQNGDENPISDVHPDTPLKLVIRYQCKRETSRGHFFIRVTTPDTFPLYTSYSELVPLSRGNGEMRARFPSFSLLEGEYCLWAGIFGERIEEDLYHESMLRIHVHSGKPYPDPKFGIYHNPITWEPDTPDQTPGKE